MDGVRIDATTNPRQIDTKIIDNGIVQYNRSKIGPQKFITVGCFARIDEKVVGGVVGSLFWNYLYIDIMWIAELHRRKGIGRQLIEGIEQLSVENGIYRSHLCTASFQSVGFYEKCGYVVFGKLDEMPEGETEYYLHKGLQTER